MFRKPGWIGLAFDRYSKKFLYFVKSMFRRFPPISRQILLDVRGDTQITSDLGMGGRVPGDTENTAAILEGDPHITRDLGMGIPKTRGYPNHCDSGLRFGSGGLAELKRTSRRGFSQPSPDILLHQS